MKKTFAILIFSLCLKLPLIAQGTSTSNCLQAFFNDPRLSDELNDFELKYCDSNLRLSTKNINLEADYFLNDFKLDTSNSNYKECTWIYYNDLKRNNHSVLFKTPIYHDGNVGTSKQILFEFKTFMKDGKCTVKKYKVIRRNSHSNY